MTALPLQKPRNDDPLMMRELLQKAASLSEHHDVTCTMVGMAANEGDLLFPEIVNFIESALRVDDGIFRMTRERAVLFLADVDRAKAEEIVRRNLAGFRERFATASDPAISFGYFEMNAHTQEATMRDVLPRLFTAEPGFH
jgi:hypothetical protein